MVTCIKTRSAWQTTQVCGAEPIPLGHFLFIFLSPLFKVKNRIEDVHGGCKVLFLVKIIYDDVSVNTFVWMPLAKRMNKSHSHKAKSNT